MWRFGLALGLAMAVGAVQAQPLSKMIARSGLSPEDFTLLSEAAQQLYEADSPQKGRSASWSNPESGAHGTVEVTGVQQNCVSLKHLVHRGGEAEPVELLAKRCKAADGRWLLQP